MIFYVSIGVLLFSLLDYAEGNDRLVVMDAKSMTPLAQVFFEDVTAGIIPEGDHAIFIPA